MPGKRVQFDDETWEAIEAVARDSGKSFQELANEAGGGRSMVTFGFAIEKPKS
jgi:hypothetical protein